MTGYYFDTYAIIELLKGNPLYEFTNEEAIITSTMNLAELYYSLLLEKGKDNVDSILNKLNLEFLEITPKVARASSYFRYNHKKAKLSYIDCVGYTLAKENKLLFLTGDKEFEKLENVRFIK